MYLYEKVEGYKAQDIRAGRKIDDFITPSCIIKRLEFCNVCTTCREPFEYKIHNGVVTSNLTVDRISNAICHSKYNSQLMCKLCNVTKGNRFDKNLYDVEDKPKKKKTTFNDIKDNEIPKF